MKPPYEHTVSTRMAPSYRLALLQYGSPPLIFRGDVITERRVSEISRSFTPGYGRLKKGAKRFVAPLSYERSLDTTIDGVGTYSRHDFYVEDRYNDDGTVTTVFAGFLPTTILSGPGVAQSGPTQGDMSPWISEHKSDVVAVATNKVLLNLKDQKVNLAQTVAESGQTMAMMSDLVRKLALTLPHLARGDLSGAAMCWGLIPTRRAVKRYRRTFMDVKSQKEFANMMSSGLLQVQYGIIPLLNDITGSAELLAQRHTAEMIGVTKGGFSSHKELKDAWITKECKNFFEASYLVNCRYTLRYSANDPVHLAAQMGLLNLPLLGWELLPYSFVVDQFLPIGNFLSTWDATAGLSFKDGTQSIRESYSDRRTFSEQQSTAILKIEGQGSTSYRRESFKRNVLGSFPSPCLPVPKVPSITHFMNDLALLVQAGLKVNRKQKSYTE